MSYMYYIKKLPYLLCILCTGITGIICHTKGMSGSKLYSTMITASLLTLILGIFIRLQAESILEKVMFYKNETLDKKENTRTEDQKEGQKTVNAGQKAQNQKNKGEQNQNEQIQNIKTNSTDNDSDEFSPLKVSKVIRTKMNEN